MDQATRPLGVGDAVPDFELTTFDPPSKGFGSYSLAANKAAGKWSILAVPEPLWGRRGSGIPLEHSFLFGSYRNRIDAAGDFILLDGYNGASRNPYHTFGILDLRINGYTLLKGYHNQVLPSADGMVEPQVAMDAALLHRDVIGGTAAAVAEVPRIHECPPPETADHALARLQFLTRIFAPLDPGFPRLGSRDDVGDRDGGDEHQPGTHDLLTA